MRIQEQVCHSLLQVIFPTQGSNPGLLHCRQILYQLNQDGKIHLNVLAPAESQSCFPSPVFFETLFPEEQRSNSSPAPPPTDSEQSPNTPAVSSLRFLHLQPAPRNPWGSTDAALDPELVLQQQRSHLWKEFKLQISWKFPGSLKVRTGSFHGCGPGSVPGQRTKIPQAPPCSQKIKNVPLGSYIVWLKTCESFVSEASLPVLTMVKSQHWPAYGSWLSHSVPSGLATKLQCHLHP